MGIFKAGSKFIARKVNDSVTNRQRDTVQEKTYRQTGKQLQQASKQGRHVNGRALYEKNLKRNTRAIEQNSKNREKFINDL